MESWRKGLEFISMIDRKQLILRGNILKNKNRLSQVKFKIAECQQEHADINQQIKMLTPAGVLSQADIYKGLRQQGGLLTHQQMIYHKISQLEDEQFVLERNIAQDHTAMALLDKKHYKFNSYLSPLRREFIRRSENNEENEVQEIAVYDRKNI